MLFSLSPFLSLKTINKFLKRMNAQYAQYLETERQRSELKLKEWRVVGSWLEIVCVCVGGEVSRGAQGSAIFVPKLLALFDFLC